METIGLVWIYCGSDLPGRVGTVEAMVSAGRIDVRLVPLAGNVAGSVPGPARVVIPPTRRLDDVLATFPADTGVVVFWWDDDKSVVGSFPRDLSIPLVEGHRDLHYWDRNALAVRWDRDDSLLDGLGETPDLGSCSVLELMSALIGHRAASSGRRLGIALASEDRYLRKVSPLLERAS